MLRKSLVPVFALMLAVGCSSGGGDFNLISLEEEWQLGNRLAADIEQQMTMVRDPAVNQYVSRLGQSIVNRTPMAQLPWNFHVVQNDEINAFVIPGGHVYVTTGLIKAADQASELAGVMAHEIAHGVERHSTEQMTRAHGLNLVASLVLGQNPATYQAILAQVVGGGAMASFSRDAEREADNLAVQWLPGIGFHPEGMATMFEELLRHRQASPNAVNRFFSSHPLTESRIRDVREQIAT
ncbi:MAG: M48 family metalloprotease, partial [Acidobacteria bacterium]|nr:M48 family metalloprotease [Acidobacteriota bacterium]